MKPIYLLVFPAWYAEQSLCNGTVSICLSAIQFWSHAVIIASSFNEQKCLNA